MNKLIFALLLALVLTSCASYEVTRETNDSKTTLKVFSWRKFDGLEATYGDFKIKTGKVSSALDSTAAMCMLFPHLCPPPDGG